MDMSSVYNILWAITAAIMKIMNTPHHVLVPSRSSGWGISFYGFTDNLLKSDWTSLLTKLLLAMRDELQPSTTYSRRWKRICLDQSSAPEIFTVIARRDLGIGLEYGPTDLHAPQ
jgi:hypothetical protein